MCTVVCDAGAQICLLNCGIANQSDIVYLMGRTGSFRCSRRMPMAIELHTKAPHLISGSIPSMMPRRCSNATFVGSWSYCIIGYVIILCILRLS